MGIDVSLVTVANPGTSPRRRKITRIATYFDDGDRFADLCEKTDLPMLSRGVRWKSLELSPSEMPQLLAELKQLSMAEQEAFQPIAALARRCAADPASALHLDGD